MKNFSDFGKSLAETDFPSHVSTMMPNLTPDEAEDILRVLLIVLKEYHEWNQQDQ